MDENYSLPPNVAIITLEVLDNIKYFDLKSMLKKNETKIF